MSKTVLVVLPKSDADSEAKAGTIARLGAARRWRVLPAEYYRTADGRLRLDRSPCPAETPAELVERLRPDGIVVFNNTISFAEARQLAGKGIPLVFPGRTPDPGWKAASPAGFVFADQRDIAAHAARVLLSSGYGHFGYVPFGDSGSLWSRERGVAFERLVREAGKDFHLYERRAMPSAPTAPAASADRAEELAGWLESLPKPCGIFAAYDVGGESVLRACATCGLRVPEDIAVVGVDNLEHVCEATLPTLSSVAMDSQAECREAVALLAEMMGRRARGRRFRPVPVGGVVLRASSRFCRDRRVARAQEFIRLNACREKFGPRDVVKTMGISRTQSDVVFRAATGHTILDEIHAVRIARAKELLSEGRRSDFVASACGYASIDDFRRDFRRRLGTTPRKWMLKDYGP